MPLLREQTQNLTSRSSIPFNLWRASHWYNKPSKKIARPSKHDYKYYFANNVFITTSGNFSTPGLKFCVEELGVGRCLFSIGKFLRYHVLREIGLKSIQTRPMTRSKRPRHGGERWILTAVRKSRLVA